MKPLRNGEVLWLHMQGQLPAEGCWSGHGIIHRSIAPRLWPEVAMVNDSQASDARLAGATSGAESSKALLNDFPGALSLPAHRTSPASASLRHLPASLFRYRVVKRILDILLVILAMPVLLPLLLLVALVVRLNSPGPVFFSHRRICREGAFFSMWKFRTMCVNSSDVLEQHLARNPQARVEWNRTHKLRVDPRITSVGHFLRRYSLDELPQVWNVLSGKMSLVGPRPIVAAEVEKYAGCFDFYCRVKPGVTGLWQVSGRSKLTYDERVALDCDYVNHWSLLKDLSILFRTFRSVVNQEGAY